MNICLQHLSSTAEHVWLFDPVTCAVRDGCDADLRQTVIVMRCVGVTVSAEYAGWLGGERECEYLRGRGLSTVAG